jgi:hypothetical protein
MPQRMPKNVDRRRSARFSCGGQAKISRLPSNGIFVPGTLRDLSLHGCCVDTTLPVDDGMKTEIVVRVNAASFRAVGEVKGIRGASSAGVEFVQLSTGGKDLLAELVEELEKLQTLMQRLKSARREMDTVKFRRDLADVKFAGMLSQHFPILGAVLGSDSALDEDGKNKDRIVKAPLDLNIDLFG